MTKADGAPLAVGWFSAGVSSAVAIKLVCDRVDKIIYTHIEDQHEDTLRFVEDCASWFGKPVEILRSPLSTVRNACMLAGFVNSPYGAPCTERLKKRVRKEWELDNLGLLRPLYVWGMDSSKRERARAARLEESMSHCDHEFPLIARGLTKTMAHGILEAAGIKRPAMYDMGYPNNNCIACVKGGMGYWNKIRVDFPEVFADRARMEREIGGSCINGVFLDELDPARGRGLEIIVPECGPMCSEID